MNATRLVVVLAFAGAIGSTVALGSNAPAKKQAPPAQGAKPEHTPPAGPVRLAPPPAAYVGTHISPQKAARGEALRLQEAIARKFAEADPQNNLRHLAFAFFRAPEFRIRGWAGQIEEVVPAPNGWRVKVHIVPIFNSSVTLLGRGVTETYGYSTNRLELLETDAKPGQTFSCIID